MEVKRCGEKEFLSADKLRIRENEIHIWCICWPEMTDFWKNHEYILSEQEYHKEIAGKQTVNFNISHSGEFILEGFAVGMDIGVDVQEMAGCPDYREIAGNFYTAEEAEDVINEGPELFFQYWAAKEAYVKAIGIGLGRGMDFFSVRNGKIAEKGRKGQGWHLYPVKIEGYAAYVAAHKKGDKSNEL